MVEYWFIREIQRASIVTNGCQEKFQLVLVGIWTQLIWVLKILCGGNSTKRQRLEIKVGNNPVSFRDDSGQLDIEAMKRLIDIEPVGLLKDGRDDVGMVHLGIICKITTREQNVEMGLKTREEAVNFSYSTYSEYEFWEVLNKSRAQKKSAQTTLYLIVFFPPTW